MYHFPKLSHTCGIGFGIPLVKRICIFNIWIKNCKLLYEKIFSRVSGKLQIHTKADKISVSVIYFVIPFINILDPFINQTLTSENLGWSAMLPQVSLRYSRTGIVQKALGSFELENVCFTLAGSLKNEN